MLNARFDTLITPLSMDVSTGDAITPHAVQYNFSEIIDDEKTYAGAAAFLLLCERNLGT